MIPYSTSLATSVLERLLSAMIMKPPWLTDSIKRMIYFKEEIYKHFQKNNNNQQLEYLDNLTCRLANLVEEEKANYYDRLSRMLNDPKTSSKKYWSLLKTLINSKKLQ